MSDLKPGDRVIEFKPNDRIYRCRQIGERPHYISSCGEVLSMAKGYPVVLKGGRSEGYRCVALTGVGPQVLLRHHHLVMRYWVGPRPIGMVINHKNGIKTDNRLENLEYCTPKDNREHAMAMRLYKSGSAVTGSKLTEEEVHLIREARKIGFPYSHLARTFRVNKKAIIHPNGHNGTNQKTLIPITAAGCIKPLKAL